MSKIFLNGWFRFFWEMERMENRIAEDEKKKLLMQELKGRETVTKGGRKIHLYANIGNVADTVSAL